MENIHETIRNAHGEFVVSLNHHKLYLDEVFALAKTLSIKSEYSAAQMNARLVQLYGPQIVNQNQPSTWKYYLNRCGRYHSTDTRMQVISLDTLQPIEFSKESLVLHTATARDYQYGTRYYKELVAQYPEQEALILGILYPADMAYALAAPDFSILSWNPALVESNEETFIKDLDTWCRTYKRRWWVSDFNVNHSLYAASFFGVFYQALPLRMLELRERACGTAQAHSFHVRMHLAGHNGLDEFLPYLTQKQAMYLYRNVAYHQRHAGQKASFEALVKNILTDRGLPLVSYKLVHNTDGFENGAVAPQVGFVAEAINNVRAPTGDIVDSASVLSRISQSASGNEDYNLRFPDDLADKRYSVQNAYPTKVLESTFVDIGEGSAVSIIEMAMSMWAYASCTDRFNIYIRVNNPETGVEVTMSALDAYYLYLYAYAKAHSGGMPNIPPVFASQAPVWPVPSLNRLLGLTIQEEVNPVRIEQMRSLMPQARTYLNLEQFQSGIEDLESAMGSQLLIQASADTFERQSSYKAVFQALWSDKDFHRPETGQASDAYFVSKDMDMGELSSLQWQELYMTIFTAVTGLDMQTTAAQSNMQTAMIEIMRRLSSYTVLFVEPLGSSVMRTLGWSNLIIQEAATSARNYYEIPIHNSDIHEVEQRAKLHFAIDIGGMALDFYVKARDLPLVMDNTSEILFLSEDNDNIHEIMISPVGVTPINLDGDSDVGFIPGLQDVLDAIALDEAYYREIYNAYNYGCWPRVVSPTKVDPNDWMVIDHLPILQSPFAGPTTLGDFRPLSIPQRIRYFSDDVDVVELNGIWSNYGDVEVNAFEASIRRAQVDPFNLMPWFVADIEAWKPNIGNLTTDRFDAFGNVPDFTELDAFQPMPLQEEVPLKSTGVPLSVEVEFHASGNAEFRLNQGQQGIDLPFRNRTNQANLPQYNNRAMQAQLAFNQRPFAVDIGRFRATIVPIEGFTLTSKTLTYQLLPMTSMARNVNIGKFYNYATLELTPLTNKVRLVQADLQLIQRVTHLNFALVRKTAQADIVITHDPENPEAL